MTEISFFWGGRTVGDATSAPYDSDEFLDVMRKMLMRDRTLQGIINSFNNELAVSNPAGNTIRVATGAALVDGSFYENDANDDTVISTPAGATRIDRVVLRKSWALQTVRIAFLTGVEGGGVPALTQTDNVTWEIPLAQVSITTGDVITITDERVDTRTPLAPTTLPAMVLIEEINGDGVITSFDFSSIPTTFSHLLLIGSGAIATAVLEATLLLRFNADAGANYNHQRLRGANVTVTATGTAGDTEIEAGFIVGSSGVANHASGFRILITGYKQTTLFKSALCENAHIPNNTVANFDVQHTMGLWRNAATINQVTLLNSSGGAIITGSKASLYGLL